MAIDDMIIERDVPIPMDDGNILRGDVFRPKDDKPAPVIMTMGPYGKGVRYEDGYSAQYKWMRANHPNILPGSTQQYMTWETPDPETWVKWGYVVVRVDSRGAGRSPGKLDIFSPRETKDYYDAIEWAAAQIWCSGKVGLLGISYYAINQWLVAALQPPHLSAIIPWEGAADHYRDVSRHGGIMSNAFFKVWYDRQVVSVQHGNPDSHRDIWLGESASGPQVLSKVELETNRTSPSDNILERPLDDQFYRDRTPDWSKVVVPFLSAASWAGFGLHPRGNFEAFTQAASKQKWLEGHPGKHEEWFYLEKPMAMQKRFLEHFLKDVKNGWDEEPAVILNLRRPFSNEFELRKEQQWPLTNTRWTPMYLSAQEKSLAADLPTNSSTVAFDALGQPVTFLSAPLERETELTGQMSAKVFISSSTTDADLFITLQAFSPEGREVEFQGTIDPHTPLAQGWLRASHRKLDIAKSLPYRPYHAHDEEQPLQPGRIYELDIEILPTCIILPAGFRLAVQISGHDFERDVPNDPNGLWMARGSGPFLHTHEIDRQEGVFGGRTTIHTGPETKSFLTLPVIVNI
jgi:predicted acyl esterase